MYDWVTLLYGRNWHSTVHQLYLNKKIFKFLKIYKKNYKSQAEWPFYQHIPHSVYMYLPEKVAVRIETTEMFLIIVLPSPSPPPPPPTPGCSTPALEFWWFGVEIAIVGNSWHSRHDSVESVFLGCSHLIQCVRDPLKPGPQIGQKGWMMMVSRLWAKGEGTAGEGGRALRAGCA